MDRRNQIFACSLNTNSFNNQFTENDGKRLPPDSNFEHRNNLKQYLSNTTNTLDSNESPGTPPLSPNEDTITNCSFKNIESQQLKTQEISIENNKNISTIVPRKKSRFYLLEAPPEIRTLFGIKDDEEDFSSSNSLNIIMNRSRIESAEKAKIVKRRHGSRKNPYPMRSPSKTSGGITFKVKAFKDIMYFDPLQPCLTRPFDQTNPVSFESNNLFFSSNESSEPSTPKPYILNSTYSLKCNNKSKKQKEIRRKGNSLARVLADQGLLDMSLNPVGMTSVLIGDLQANRPAIPVVQLEISHLLKELSELQLDNSLLEIGNIDVSWKGHPLSIQNLPHFEELHQNEIPAASTFRLTPLQYLNAKHCLITASRRYRTRSLPFRKSDAQRLLRIDVNKASKLWEFFNQVGWI
ncbi:hypothetical protein G9A89_015836 [Geosiphon pyriformis]|nr:hypothetical protein G9A89_015836 [Geosiphon pyriformis]